MTTLACFILGTVFAISSADAAPQGGDYRTPRLVVPAPTDPNHAHLGWPKLARCKDGTILLGVIAGKEHTKQGCPAIYRSTDDGKTFGDIQILKQFGPGKDYPHCGNITLGIADDGAAVLLAMAHEGNKRNGIFGWRSTDSGKTWTPVDTSELTDNKTGSTYGSLVSVPGLGLAAFGHYRQPGKPSQGIWMSVSKDDGRSWGKPKQIVTAKEYEPSFTFSEGRLIGLLRPDMRCYDQAVSDDLGKTWEFKRRVIGLPNGETHSSVPSPFITTAPNDPSTLYALRCERGGHNGSSGRVYLMTADAETLDWKELGLLIRMPKNSPLARDWSYPWMIPLDDHQWFLVFYAGSGTGACSIYGMTFELP